MRREDKRAEQGAERGGEARSRVPICSELVLPECRAYGPSRTQPDASPSIKKRGHVGRSWRLSMYEINELTPLPRPPPGKKETKV